MATSAENAEVNNRGLEEHYARVRANEAEVKATMKDWHTALNEVRARVVALEAIVANEGWRS